MLNKRETAKTSNVSSSQQPETTTTEAVSNKKAENHLKDSSPSKAEAKAEPVDPEAESLDLACVETIPGSPVMQGTWFL